MLQVLFFIKDILLGLGLRLGFRLGLGLRLDIVLSLGLKLGIQLVSKIDHTATDNKACVVHSHLQLECGYS